MMELIFTQVLTKSSLFSSYGNQGGHVWCFKICHLYHLRDQARNAKSPTSVSLSTRYHIS